MALLQDQAPHVAHAVNTLTEAVSRFGIPGIALSFNGGKDCTVMLHLLAQVLRSHASQSPASPVNSVCLAATASLYPQIPCLYVTTSDPFPEVDAFVDEMAVLYNLSIYKTTASMKDGLQLFLDTYPSVKAVLVGTRRTDPYSANLKEFDPTNNGWPACIRVHPILDWSYGAIWDYLRDEKVPYCSLYDEGYTSLGGINNTLPNPALKKENGEGYHPAYMLLDGSRERDGRVKK